MIYGFKQPKPGAGTLDTIQASQVVEGTLEAGNLHLSEMFGADVLVLSSPMGFGLDDIVKNEVENIKDPDMLREEEKPREKLVVLLETTGGYVEVVERIVAVFRHHYSEVEFVIPNYAYSAGTVLALSGDEIHMNYYSVLGPIDPQFEMENGQLPGMGYIAKYNELVQLVNGTADQDIGAVKAEMALLLNKFDPALLFHIEQSIRHSQELVERWLPIYKFKNWTTTATRGQVVDEGYKKERAQKIAEKLGDAEHWHSHGRGISMEALGSDEIGLKVQDFGSDKFLEANITNYFGLFKNYLASRQISNALHTKHRLRGI